MRSLIFIYVFLIGVFVGCDNADFTSISKSTSRDNDSVSDGSSSGGKDGGNDGGNDGSDLGSGEGVADGGLGNDGGLGQGELEYDERVATGQALRELCGTDRQKEKTINLNFPSTKDKNDCAWGVDGNLPYQKGTSVVRAFRKQTETIEIPEGAVLCEINLDSDTPSIQYDDYLFLDFEGLLMGASSHTRQDFLDAGMTEEAGLLKFEPAKAIENLGTTVAHNKRSSSFCPMDSECIIPSSDQAQPMKINIPHEWFKNIPDKILIKNVFELTVRVSGQGDGERQDCEHSGFGFQGTVKYVE